jgi:hypothetical protein
MKLEPATEELYAANGTKIATLGAAEIPLRRGGMVLPVDALVTEYVREPMLGMDWMLKNGCILNFVDLTATMQGQAFPLEKKETRGLCRRVVVAHRVEVPAWCQQLVEGRVELDSLKEVTTGEWCTEVQEVGPGLCVARAVVPSRLDNLPIVVMNVSQEATILDAGADLAELTPVVVELGTGLEDGSE